MFAFIVCAFAAIFAGILPALYRSRRTDPLTTNMRSSDSPALVRFQRSLMVGQIALGVALLASAGLLTHSLLRLKSVDPGFRTRDTIGFEVAFPSGRQAEAPRLYRSILDAVRSTPRVVSAGWITNLPPETRAGVFMAFSIHGAGDSNLRQFCNYQVTSEDYFRTAAVPLLRGRDFTVADDVRALRVAIINDALARQYFPSSNPIGKRIAASFDGSNNREIIGVIGDIHDRGLSAKSIATIYVPYRQFQLAYGSVVARTFGPGDAILPEIRRRVLSVDPSVAMRSLMTIAARVRKTLDAPRFYTVMAVGCALLATLFVALGLYGVVSFAVSRRTSEIGIRMALGAQRDRILRDILWQWLSLAAIGVAAGMGIAMASSRFLASMLFEVKPIDPWTLGIAAILVVLVTLLAGYAPARRASRIDPTVALRYE